MPIKITNFVHHEAAAAQTALEALGFKVIVVQTYNDNVAAGLVVSQTPRAGVGTTGDHIRLVTSLGPHLVQVPDVYHQGTEAAKQTLEDAGFRVSVQPFSPSFGLGFVEDQSPGGDEMAPLGSTVIIYIV